MSIAAIDWAFKQADLSPTNKLVLIALADHANDAGQCWPGWEHIAAKTNLSKASIYRAYSDLEQRSLLSLEPDESGRDLKVLSVSDRDAESQSETAESQGETGPYIEEPSEEPSKKQKDGSASPTCSDEVRSVWSEYERLFGPGRGKGLTESKERIIKTALKEYEAPDLCKALRGLKKHREGPGQGRSTDIAAALKTNPKSGPLHEHIGFWIEFEEKHDAVTEQDDLDLKTVRREQGLE